MGDFVSIPSEHVIDWVVFSVSDRKPNSRSENITPQDEDRPPHGLTTTEVFLTQQGSRDRHCH